MGSNNKVGIELVLKNRYGNWDYAKKPAIF